MRYYHFQIKYRAGDNYIFYEEHVGQHQNANDEKVRDLLAFRYLNDSWEDLSYGPGGEGYSINTGEVLAEITKTAELTEKEYNILKRYI